MLKLEDMEGHINFEEFYDYESNSYLHDFKSKEALNAMKKIHEDYYDQVAKDGVKPSSFYQSQVKTFSPRPKELPTDFKSSFVVTSIKDKIFPLKHNFEKVDQKNCWASSRYEWGYILSLSFYLP